MFNDNADMDVQLQLERILRRMKLSAVELELQPEAFQATEELRLASGELSSVISELGRSNQRLAGAGFAFRGTRPRIRNPLGLAFIPEKSPVTALLSAILGQVWGPRLGLTGNLEGPRDSPAGPRPSWYFSC